MSLPPELSAAKLRPHWFVCAATLLSLVGYNLVCHLWGGELQLEWDEQQRVLIRSILYGVAIVLYPFVNLLRHILLRLNQTMPGSKTASQRYLLTIIVTQSLIEPVGLFGLTMFLLGDGFNTLYIFSTMHLLGIFLHKPKLNEYLAIESALSNEIS